MKRSQRLAPIANLAEDKEKAAAAELGRQQQQVESMRKNLSSLHGFRENYSARFQSSGAGGLSVKQLTEYRAFLAKINGIIEEQDQTLLRAEAELERRLNAWQAAHRHTEGVKMLIEQAHNEEMQLEYKREQAESDERAGRKAARNTERAES